MSELACDELKDNAFYKNVRVIVNVHREQARSCINRVKSILAHGNAFGAGVVTG